MPSALIIMPLERLIGHVNLHPSGGNEVSWVVTQLACMLAALVVDTGFTRMHATPLHIQHKSCSGLHERTPRNAALELRSRMFNM